MKYIAPSEKVAKQLPSEQLLNNYGRSSKLLLAEKDIPDLHFDVKDRKEKGDLSEKTEVMGMTDVNTGGMMPLNSDFQEHLRNSLESAAGEELELVSEQRSVKQALDSELHSNASEYREHSQKSQNSGKPTDVEMPRKLVKQTFSRDTHLQHSESREHSQNSRIKQVGIEEVTVSTKDTKRKQQSAIFQKILQTRRQVVNAKWIMKKQRCLLVIVTVSV